jgi:hypothetical protein
VIPVEQRQLWRPDDHPDGPQRGDCFRACVASILELAYEDVPDLGGYTANLATWLKATMPGINVSDRYVCTGWDRVETLDSWRSWPERHYESGYWIGTVYSHRIPDREMRGCGCTQRSPEGDPNCKWCGGDPSSRSLGIEWGLHAVVMNNANLAWDPHPERDRGFGPFRSAKRFVLEDPAPAIRALRMVKEGLRDGA